MVDKVSNVAMSRRDWLVLVGFIAVVAAVAVAASLATIRASTVYQDLDGPAWAPPAWLFGPVWTALYLMIAVSGWLAWRAGIGWREPGMAAYGLQLVLNGLWSPLFFALQWRGVALACIIAMDVTVAATTSLFWRRDRVSGLLLVPYLLWILFATALNLAYWTMNR